MNTQLAQSQELIRNLERTFPNFDIQERRIWVHMVRALAEGNPVPAARVAEDAGIPESEVRRFIDVKLGTGWRYSDEDGRVVGFGGLTIQPLTPHQIEVDGQTLYAWCALDTLFLPQILEQPAEVRSVCPVTERPITLRVTPDRVEHAEPPEAVVSFLTGDAEWINQNVFLNFCHHVHFFASEQAGRQWQATHPHSALLTLSEAFALGREMVIRKFS